LEEHEKKVADLNKEVSAEIKKDKEEAKQQEATKSAA
jgi:hypothetical protein